MSNTPPQYRRLRPLLEQIDPVTGRSFGRPVPDALAYAGTPSIGKSSWGKGKALQGWQAPGLRPALTKASALTSRQVTGPDMLYTSPGTYPRIQAGMSPVEAEEALRRLRFERGLKNGVSQLENIAPYASNIINSFRRAPRPTVPRPYQYNRLTPVSYGASRAEAERAVYGANQGLNALGENAATAVRTANLTQGIRSVNQINEAEANENAQISNRVGVLNTQIANSNVDNLNRFDDMNVNAQMIDVQQQSANMANAADKYIAIRNQQRLADLEGQKFQVLSKIYEESGVLDRVIGDNPLDPRTQIPRMSPKAKLGAGGMLRRIDPGPKDSTFYYGEKAYHARLKQGLTSTNYPEWRRQIAIEEQALADMARQANKGKPGFDENGFRKTSMELIHRLHKFPAK